MKSIFRVFVLSCLFYSIVNGMKANKANRPKEITSLDVDPVIYDPEENFLKHGISKSITCRGSQRLQQIEWYDPDGEQMKRDRNQRVFVQDSITSVKSKAPSLVLVFKEAFVEDSGVWECRSGEMVQEVPLCVLDPLVFVNTPTEVTIDEGRAITLTCQARGNPEPKIVWYKNGEVISEADEKIYISTKYNQHGFEGLLTIKSLTADDSGTYICEGVQETPNMDECSHVDSLNITLNVNQRPKFDESLETEEPKYVFAKENELVDLICNPSAYPKPKFRWFKESKDVWTEYSERQFKVTNDGTQSIFPIVGNSSTFNEKFRCMAKNIYGSATAVFELKKLVKPLRVTEYYVSNATDTSIWFNVTGIQDCDPCKVTGVDIQYFERKAAGSPKEAQWKRAHIAQWVTEDEEAQFGDFEIILEDLKPDTEYWVRLRPFNSLGHAPWSLPLLVTTASLNEEPSTEPVDEKEVLAAAADYGIVYGVVMTAIIVAAGAICILLIKRL